MIGTDKRDVNAFDMLEAGMLPAYLPYLWKKANGYNPLTRKKVTKTFRGPLRAITAVLGLACLGLYVNGFFGLRVGSIPHWTFLAGFLVLSVCFFLVDEFLPEFSYSHGYEFKRSIFWLFMLSPMKASDFPKDEAELKDRYLTVMKEMAQLILLCEDNAFKDEACRAKLHLGCLFRGALAFGFIDNPEQGLKPCFDRARKSGNYRWVCPSIWLEKYGS